MSRRESRSSLGGRQTSALEEFENFKKKYLLVNKHIAKLNSSLNVRIEELLSQIASLNNDNLRLKASELSLARRLENEQDRTRRLYRETESASQLLVSQINSMKVMFGLDKPPGPSMLRDPHANRQKAIRQPHPPLSCRVARAPEFDMIIEASEEDRTPSKVNLFRRSSSPTPASGTPLGRRRSTGSTPHSTPASNAPATPVSGGQDRISDEGRRSSAPMAMEITNNSSPLTPSHSLSIANQSALVSPSPASNSRSEKRVNSPISDRGKVGADAEDDHLYRDVGKSESPSPFSPQQFNATGLKRVSRRPSGFVTEEASRPIPEPVSVSIPSTFTPNAESSAYPTPLSALPAPSTPPRQTSTIRLPGSTSPGTPTRTLPMSPKPANPALSPPPGRKLSLTRRQLDFGIVDPEDTESEDFGTEINATEPAADGLLGFQSDSVVGKRAVKRKSFEDDVAQDENDAQSANTKFRGVRVRRQERRRDTGNIVMGLTLKERDSKESSLMERGSKESLRDVTNERTSPPLAGSKSLDAKDATAANNSKVDGGPAVTVGKGHFSRVTVANMAAKLERLSSRPKPLSAPTPVPLPSSDKDIKIPLAPEEQPDEAVEAAEEAAEEAAAELGRRNSGRQRKSVNYKEPSLITKMRKPDSNPGSTTPSSAPSSSSTTGSSAGSLPTVTIVPRPPKRKKGSISLISEMTASSSTGMNGTGDASATTTTPYLSLASGDGESRRSSKLNLLEPAPGLGDAQIKAQKRASRALWEKYIDLSDEEDGNAAGGDKDSPSLSQTEPGGGYLSSETGSRYSFAGLSGLRGGSILAKGPNPIIANGTPAPTIRSTASLRITPGAARERVREELVGGAGARREREKEREREREREQEADKGSNGIVI